MLSLQHSLKKLPVPSLEETLAKYLRSIESLTTPEELERSKALAKDFIKPGGLGQVLQQRLLDVDRAAPHNWLDDTWWISKAYHEWRVPLIVNSNWYILVNNETNHPKEFYPTAENPAYTTFQVKRAAHVTQQLLDYIDTLNSQNVPVDKTRAGPLCMRQYTQLIGFTRIPQHGCDRLVNTAFPSTSKHIILIIDDQLFKVDVCAKDGGRFLDGDMERQFLNAIKQLKQIKQSAPVGLLTCDDRDAWAVAREHLLVLDPTNRESMQVIEDSLFCIVLDSVAEPTKADPETNFSEWAKFGMHGHGGRNRWCDKSINLLFERDGKMVCYGEHSPCDALIPALIMDTIVRKPTDLNAASSNVDIEAPRHLPFVTDAKTQEHLKAASATIEALSKNSDCGIVHFKDYGVDFIKKYAKVSPDAYIQMALQLAYFKQTGEPCATYETGSTRQFLHGRTETIRTLSPDSLAFCKAMQNPSTTPEERVKLLRVATIAHSQYQKDAGNGKGCDRHLLGLRLCLQPGESHDLFKEPVFAKSTDFLLSTSGLFAGDYFTGTGFGCVSPNGYGINYMPGGKVIKFGIESKFDSKKTDTRAFGELIHQAFREMRAAVEQTLPEDLRKTSAKL
ncbi:acyltransferase ChoActase/COT/CPT [Lobosporangium transversale]|uniref:Acyltransferase ChoActase/COT/CPT n=1 Tax=Lobosporangium transversale TaxID=64571 RepID=A0A1Y2GBD7_9FUNG|nr:acyltransferase ChoActase/COT/CPT [Lobosporangium transversale]ORZ04825.1 acyltransferase ChoActase/COT/CPT [Lobosporangium transversale]|eukprot:XP_021876762.1 acyltransferase ChoActase/COT/CPT [Lobosporangium transversale]